MFMFKQNKAYEMRIIDWRSDGCSSDLVASLVTANLFGRMTPALALDIPSVPIVAPLPWAGMDLREHVLAQLWAADPFGKFAQRSTCAGDYIVHLGRSGAPAIVHGTGWNLYAGPAPSPLADSRQRVVSGKGWSV